MSLKKIGTHAEQNFTILLVLIPARQEDVIKRWKEVKATALGNHEIQDHVAKRIQIRVLDAPVVSDICLDGNSYIQRLFFFMLNPIAPVGYSLGEPYLVGTSSLGALDRRPHSVVAHTGFLK